MPKTPPLCTGAESNLKDRVLGEVEEKIFITLPGKGRHMNSNLKKPCVPTPEVLMKGFITMVQDKIRVCIGPAL